MSYHYYQQNGGDEKWQPVKADKLDTIDGAMFCTILSVDVPIADDASREDLAVVKYRGSLYFDLDDATSPASTAKYAMELVGKLEQHGVPARQLELYASGGKGFHILVPEDTPEFARVVILPLLVISPFKVNTGLLVKVV